MRLHCHNKSNFFKYPPVQITCIKSYHLLVAIIPLIFKTHTHRAIELAQVHMASQQENWEFRLSPVFRISITESDFSFQGNILNSQSAHQEEEN